jgi:hypothetical protein
LNKIRLLFSFNLNFYKHAMVDNIKSPLFKSIDENLEIKINNYGEDKTDAEMSLDIVMEELLSRIAQLTSENSTTSMESIQNIARRSPSPANTSIQR